MQRFFFARVPRDCSPPNQPTSSTRLVCDATEAPPLSASASCCVCRSCIGSVSLVVTRRFLHLCGGVRRRAPSRCACGCCSLSFRLSFAPQRFGARCASSAVRVVGEGIRVWEGVFQHHFDLSNGEASVPECGSECEKCAAVGVDRPTPLSLVLGASLCFCFMSSHLFTTM